MAQVILWKAESDGPDIVTTASPEYLANGGTLAALAATLPAVSGSVQIVDASEVPEPEPAPRRFSKRLLFGAMTDDQYATWKQVQALQPERLQAVFAAATELNESDPDWSILLALMNAYLGEAETAALLDAAELLA